MQWFCTIKQPKIIDPVALEKKTPTNLGRDS